VNIYSKFDLTGRVAVVTGGPGLLGAGFCQSLAEAGATVVVADVNEKGCERLAKKFKTDGLKAVGMGLDITSKASTHELVKHVVKTLGRLDILVNSAALDPKVDAKGAVQDNGAFESFSLDAWNQALNVNLTGTFLMTQAAVRPMLTQKSGVIINLCSIYGISAPIQGIYQRPEKPAQFKPVYYTVTKAGILGLTKYLASYYAEKGVRVNALTPGGVYNNQDDQFVKNYSAHAILGRMANKDEMNGALLFLASDASSYMTGSNLIVDGGWTAW
jgi:2-deoxy-D-gluconate 3-dehydrogenase